MGSQFPERYTWLLYAYAMKMQERHPLRADGVLAF